MTTLFVAIRHGERVDRQGPGSAVLWRETCPAGQEHDPPLSGEGRRQALATATAMETLLKPLGSLRTLSIVSSPLVRCIQTANSIAAHLQTQLHQLTRIQTTIDSRLYELFTEELFPSKPAYVVIPDLQRCEGVDMFSASSNVVTDSIDVLSRFPESKTMSTERTRAALREHLSSTMSGVACDAAGTSEPIVKNAVLFVAHQFNVKLITSELTQLLPQWRQRSFGKKPPNWRKVVAAAVSENCLGKDGDENAVEVQSRTIFQTSVQALEFDPCSISAFIVRVDTDVSEGLSSHALLVSYTGHLVGGDSMAH